MIGDDAHCHIGLLILAIGASTDLANTLEHRLEHIGIVIAGFALDSAYQALKTHTRVNNFLG